MDNDVLVLWRRYPGELQRRDVVESAVLCVLRGYQRDIERRKEVCAAFGRLASNRVSSSVMRTLLAC
jgi:hypothetical protein